MSIRPDMHIFEKAIWVVVLVSLTVLEIKAIVRSDKETGEVRRQQNEEFRRIGDGINLAIAASSAQFQATMEGFSNEQSGRQKQFKATMTQFTRNFEHQDQLAESFSGTLEPGSEPTPANNCSAGAETVMVFLGEESDANVIVVRTFPALILGLVGNYAEARSVVMGPMSESAKPLVTLTKSTDGNLAVELDIRDNDGKIIAKMGRSGFVVNRNNALKIERDKNRLRIIDDYGAEVLNVHYINKRAISVSGLHIRMTGFKRSCFDEPLVLAP